MNMTMQAVGIARAQLLADRRANLESFLKIIPGLHLYIQLTLYKKL